MSGPTLKSKPPSVDIEVREGTGASVRMTLRRAGVAIPDEFTDSVFTITAPLEVDTANVAAGSIFIVVPPEATIDQDVLHFELGEEPVLGQAILTGRVLVESR